MSFWDKGKKHDEILFCYFSALLETTLLTFGPKSSRVTNYQLAPLEFCSINFGLLATLLADQKTWDVNCIFFLFVREWGMRGRVARGRTGFDVSHLSLRCYKNVPRRVSTNTHMCFSPKHKTESWLSLRRQYYRTWQKYIYLFSFYFESPSSLSDIETACNYMTS